MSHWSHVDVCGFNMMEPQLTFHIMLDNNRTFPGKWIGRGGPVPWPARSPDLTPLDFFLWGHAKSLVLETPVETAEELLA